MLLEISIPWILIREILTYPVAIVKQYTRVISYSQRIKSVNICKENEYSYIKHG